mmetsp:Transcript_24606/g.59325  ORF Transcript_24606/g.59325 Transcript_24606/m.59325 type:complete len:371 (+) Transcript_24606:60-1172(+)
MATDSSNPIDDGFQAFLDELEQLSIHHSEASAAEKTDKGPTLGSVGAKKRIAGSGGAKKSEFDKRNALANANDNQRAWSEFKNLDLSSINNGSASNSNGDKAKVSFQIKSAKDKKQKKKKNKVAAKKQLEQENHPDEPTMGIACSETVSVPLENVDGSDCGCPRWTLIIDTCCLLNDNGRSVQGLIDMANNTANALTRAQNQKNVASMTTTVEEPIDIVIPFKVWSELEYRSKSDETDVAYSARIAIRMLRDELESRGHEKCSVLRSQSLLESHAATTKYLPKDSRPTNDDHILACAMMEDEKSRSAFPTAAKAAGGVVMVTLDNNLACKGYANGLKVDSPSKFRGYYQKRMASLRHRAAGRFAHSALRR